MFRLCFTGTQTDRTGKPATKEKKVQARIAKPFQRASSPVPKTDSDGEAMRDDPMDISWNPERDGDCESLDTSIQG